MDYPEVKKPHVVSRCRVKQFAIREQVQVHVVPTGAEHRISIDDAAVRRTFYRRTRPDGTQIDDWDWSLGLVESAVAPSLSTIEANWPLDKTTTRAHLAEFFALEAVRGPRWQSWHREHARRAVEAKRRKGVHELESGLLLRLNEEMLEQFEQHLLSETQWLIRMASSANKLIDIFGSMTWDLIKFDAPALCLSDHPIVDWPLHVGRRMPDIATGHGWANILEVRVPLAPDLALLMTWKDEPDSAAVIAGTSDDAANINAFTVAQAEKQWFWKPGSEPIKANGPFEPLSVHVCPGYERGRAERSVVRREVVKGINERLGVESNEARIVSLS